MVKGSQEALSLYTSDLDTNLPILPDKFKDMSNKEKRHTVRVEKMMLFDKMRTENKTSYQVVMMDRDFQAMRKSIEERHYRKFNRAFRKGYKMYLLGEWKNAQVSFLDAYRHRP